MEEDVGPQGFQQTCWNELLGSKTCGAFEKTCQLVRFRLPAVIPCLCSKSIDGEALSVIRNVDWPELNGA
jgi:hypothetical protein